MCHELEAYSPIGERPKEAQARELAPLAKKNPKEADEVWHLLLQAYERGAHTALGYSSWGEYFEAEFGGRKTRAYELLDAGRVVRAIETHSGIPERPNARQADELAPLVKKNPEGADELWHLLLQAYERRAHTALGYPSWGAYFEKEFGGGKRQAYRLLDAGRVVRAIEESSDPRVTRPTERQARELVPRWG